MKEKIIGFLNFNKGIYPSLCVFIFSAILRYALAIVNREANDPHYMVVDIILRESRLPHAGEGWEAYQPKLFHWAMAQGIQLLGLNGFDAQMVFMQLINATAGIIVLLCIFIFLRRLSISEPIRFWSFTLAAFNPKFIAIDSQATNDAFVILFVSLAIMAAIEFFHNNRFRYLALIIIATILAGLSKGNGLVILIALLGVWVVRMIVDGKRKGLIFIYSSILFIVLWLVAYGLIVPYYGQYIERYRENGSPFYNPIPPSPLPSLLASSTAGRPGVVSFSQSYLTFPILNLIETPVILSGGHIPNPIHRTSLWAQLYGGANFAHFEEWPVSWETNNPMIIFIGRCIMILALFPTIAGAVYFIYFIIKNLHNLLIKCKFEEEPWVHILVFIGYIMLIILYSWELRDYSTMKAIFIFPALICIVFYISNGLDGIYSWAKNKKIQFIFQVVLGSLTVFYILDISFLILQLAHDRLWL